MQQIKIIVNIFTVLAFLGCGVAVFMYGYNFDGHLALYFPFIMLGYIFLQGINFNSHSVNGYGQVAIDMLTSLLPAFFIFYIFATVELGEDLILLAYMYTFTVIIDITIFSWASLKLLLFTDKNAQSA
jgi:hypothetical protein